MSEVSTERQLEIALMLLSEEQREDFTKDLKILQLECSLMDAKRRIKKLEAEFYNRACDYPIHPAFEEKSKCLKQTQDQEAK